MKFKVIVVLALNVLLLVACTGTPLIPEATEQVVTLTPVVSETMAPTEEPAATPTKEAPLPTEEPTEEAASEEELELVQVTNETMGIQVLVPEGWDEVAPGVYPRASSARDLATLIQQAAPGTTTAQLQTLLEGQLGIDVFPEPVDGLEAGALTWKLYQTEVEAPGVGTVMVDIALSEGESAAYVVLR